MSMELTLQGEISFLFYYVLFFFYQSTLVVLVFFTIFERLNINYYHKLNLVC